MPASVRPTAAFASSGSPRRSNALRARMDPAAKSAPSKRGGLGLRRRTYSAARYALRPMRNAAIPPLTRGWFSTPARRRLVDAARTSPPAISAVIRLRTGALRRAFVRGLRAGVLGRVRTFGDSGGAVVACLGGLGLVVAGGEASPGGAPHSLRTPRARVRCPPHRGGRGASPGCPLPCLPRSVPSQIRRHSADGPYRPPQQTRRNSCR